ncbi:uncharacterized protein LOC115033004 isoform X1 [Acyrthosiphon pisum]|uniref:Uncharacterized protein n=1 Tax=Acyrthosiphon pisum TaxID=7029 RepID=A0A8R2JTE0_ACYPI|nr:uncharacterized protein LOC115033004 isoform X1 [Acyrthosiphon pisum]
MNLVNHCAYDPHGDKFYKDRVKLKRPECTALVHDGITCKDDGPANYPTYIPTDFDSVFDDDYRSKHENNIHGGKRVRVKHVGAPNNPFDLARKIYQKQTVKSDLTSTSMTVETDLNSGKDECLICPNSTCDTKTQSSPLLNLSESSTSESMTVETDLKSGKDECIICPDSAFHTKTITSGSEKKIEKGLQNAIPFDLSLTKNYPPAQPELTSFPLTNKRHFSSS